MGRAFYISLFSLLHLGAFAVPAPQNGLQVPSPKQLMEARSERPESKGLTLNVAIEQTWECSDNNSSEDLTDDCDSWSNRWFFFTTKTGEQPTDLCSTLTDFYNPGGGFGGQETIDEPVLPSGEWYLKLGGIQYEYKANGENSGALFRDVGGFEWKVGSCMGSLDEEDPLTKTCKDTSPYEKRRRVVYCDF
jgi:hypothetical protein